MLNFNFADQYKAAGLAPGPEIIKLRQTPFKKLRSDINISTILDLTRMYFGFPVPGGTDWFREAFESTDPSFTMLDNEREVAVLSACLLAAALSDGHVSAGLAPIVFSIGGRRTPSVCPEFIEEARQTLAIHSKDFRQQESVDISKIKSPVKSKVTAAIEAYSSAPELAKVSELINLVSNESLATQVVSVVSPLAKQVNGLREEVNMLWWYIGGWSRVLEKPFSDLDIGLAALMAGIDLAHLAEGKSGPAAAPAILQRLVIDPRGNGDKKISLESAVKALPKDVYKLLNIPESIGSTCDLCPVLAALYKAEEIGGKNWRATFNNVTRLKAGMLILPIELAIQVYRESLLLAQID